MSRPPLPKGQGHRHSDEVVLGGLMALTLAGWATGWLVLHVAGAEPRGGPLSAATRLGAAMPAAVRQQAVHGGWVWVAWGPARPVNAAAVAWIILVLLLVIGAVTWLVRRAIRRVAAWWEARRRGGGGGRGGPAPGGSGESLDEFLAWQQGDE